MQPQARLLQLVRQDAKHEGADETKAAENFKRQQKRAGPFIKFVIEVIRREKMKFDVRGAISQPFDKEATPPYSTMGERALYQAAYNQGIEYTISMLDLDQREK